MIRFVIDGPGDLAEVFEQRSALYLQTSQSVSTRAERERFEGLAQAWGQCAAIARCAILSSTLPSAPEPADANDQAAPTAGAPNIAPPAPAPATTPTDQETAR